jgi:hypothetical protein
VPAAAGGGVGHPRRPFVGTHGLFVRGKLGSYCVTRETGNTGVGICVTAAAPDEPPKARLPVEPSDRIEMLFPHRHRIRDQPAQLHLSLGRIEAANLETFSAHMKAHRVRGHPRKWRARAPSQVVQANALEIFETFPAGDADYFVGLRGP